MSDVITFLTQNQTADQPNNITDSPQISKQSSDFSEKIYACGLDPNLRNSPEDKGSSNDIQSSSDFSKDLVETNTSTPVKKEIKGVNQKIKNPDSVEMPGLKIIPENIPQLELETDKSSNYRPDGFEKSNFEIPKTGTSSFETSNAKISVAETSSVGNKITKGSNKFKESSKEAKDNPVFDSKLVQMSSNFRPGNFQKSNVGAPKLRTSSFETTKDKSLNKKTDKVNTFTDKTLKTKTSLAETSSARSKSTKGSNKGNESIKVPDNNPKLDTKLVDHEFDKIYNETVQKGLGKKEKECAENSFSLKEPGLKIDKPAKPVDNPKLGNAIPKVTPEVNRKLAIPHTTPVAPQDKSKIKPRSITDNELSIKDPTTKSNNESISSYKNLTQVRPKSDAQPFPKTEESKIQIKNNETSKESKIKGLNQGTRHSSATNESEIVLKQTDFTTNNDSQSQRRSPDTPRSRPSTEREKVPLPNFYRRLDSPSSTSFQSADSYDDVPSDIFRRKNESKIKNKSNSRSSVTHRIPVSSPHYPGIVTSTPKRSKERSHFNDRTSQSPKLDQRVTPEFKRHEKIASNTKDHRDHKHNQNNHHSYVPKSRQMSKISDHDSTSDVSRIYIVEDDSFSYSGSSVLCCSKCIEPVSECTCTCPGNYFKAYAYDCVSFRSISVCEEEICTTDDEERTRDRKNFKTKKEDELAVQTDGTQLPDYKF